MILRDLMKECHRIAVEKGWWGSGEEKQRNFPEQLALFHSEISEVLEEYRANGLNEEFFIYYPHYDELKKETGTKPEGIAIELADLVIRVFDTCERYEIPLEEAIKLKMEYNKKRPYRHGNKKC